MWKTGLKRWDYLFSNVDRWQLTITLDDLCKHIEKGSLDEFVRTLIVSEFGLSGESLFLVDFIVRSIRTSIAAKLREKVDLPALRVVFVPEAKKPGFEPKEKFDYWVGEVPSREALGLEPLPEPLPEPDAVAIKVS